MRSPSSVSTTPKCQLSRSSSFGTAVPVTSATAPSLGEQRSIMTKLRRANTSWSPTFPYSPNFRSGKTNESSKSVCTRYLHIAISNEHRFRVLLFSHHLLPQGCGIGTDSINFLRNGAQLVAVDISGESVKIAKARAELFGYDNAKIFQANVEQLDQSNLLIGAETQPFDLLYSFGVIHHTPNPRLAIEQISKLQEPGELRLMLYSKISYRISCGRCMSRRGGTNGNKRAHRRY